MGKNNLLAFKILVGNKQTILIVISVLAIVTVFLVLSFLFFLPFPWRETKLFTRQINEQIEKGTCNNKFKAEMPTLAGDKHFFHPSLPSKEAFVPSIDRKWTHLIRQNWTSKFLFRR